LKLEGAAIDTRIVWQNNFIFCAATGLGTRFRVALVRPSLFEP